MTPSAGKTGAGRMPSGFLTPSSQERHDRQERADAPVRRDRRLHDREVVHVVGADDAEHGVDRLQTPGHA
eukprot:11215727-Lingulodinium_polyedra.AAC.1